MAPKWSGLAALVLLAGLLSASSSKDDFGDLIAQMETAVRDHRIARGENEQPEDEEEDEFVVTASDVKDATAHAVDQTLVGKAEEELAEKESQDPLLADPLLSLEKEHKDDDKVDAEIEKLDESIEEEEERLFYDPKLFSKDTVAEMDTNNDGFLDEDELIAHLTKAIDKVRQDELLKQKEVNAEGVKEIMEMMDDNKDGKLSKEEMFGKTTQTSKQQIADNRMFDFADGAFGNKDGELDEDEIFIMALPQYSEDREAWYKFKAHDHMEEMDTNNDGYITLPEYEDAMKIALGEDFAKDMFKDARESLMPKDKLATIFKKVDANGDGKLDIGELAKMVKKLEENNMKETIDGLIEIADDNHDGKLALSEIIKHVEDFGGHISFFLNDPQLLFPQKRWNQVSSTLDARQKSQFVARAIAEKRNRVHKAALMDELGRHTEAKVKRKKGP